MKQRNTTEKGSVRTIIFKEGKLWYGAALEFNIVESGDDPREVMILLDEAIRGYIKSVKKAKLSLSVLNQEADPEYEALWDVLEGHRPVPSPFSVYSFGERSILSA